MTGTTTRSLLVLLSLAFGLAAGGRVSFADPPDEAWEQEVRREADEQTRALEQARRAKTVAAVVTAYENRVGRDPSPLNYFLLGRARFYNADPAGARTQMEAALAGNPRFWPALVKLARLAAELRNWQEADARVRAALALKPNDPEALEVSAQVAVGLKDWPRAVRAFEGLVARSPDAAAVRYNLVLAHLESKNPDAAMRELEAWLPRAPKDPEIRRLRARCFTEKRDFGRAAAELEALLAEPGLEPGRRLVLLDDLRGVYVKAGDRDKVRSVLERALPHVPPERQKAVSEMIEQLRRPPEAQGGGESRPVSAGEIAAVVESKNVEARREALALMYEACQLGYVNQVPGSVLKHVASEIEPDAVCRSWVIRIMSQLTPSILPLLSYSLYDEEREVRMLAADVIGEMKRPVGIAYLLPFVRTQGLDLAEFESIRAALSAIAQFRDRPLGQERVTTEAEAAGIRETWRRWQLSDASTPMKLAAIRELRAIDRSSPERFLYDFVLDSTFDVMREAYFAMRAALGREPRDAAEKKVFPLFPVVPDGEVTRESMAEIQRRVAAWWQTWVAERNALRRAEGK